MNTPLTPTEQAIIDAALEFANLHPIESVEQVVEIFEPVARITQSTLFQTIPDMDIGAFTDDQNNLVEWLAHPELVWGVLRKVLKCDATWDLTSDGELVSTARPRLDGVQACTALAVVLLCNRDHGHRPLATKSVNSPNCPNWVFVWSPPALRRGNHAAPRMIAPSLFSQDSAAVVLSLDSPCWGVGCP